MKQSTFFSLLLLTACGSTSAVVVEPETPEPSPLAEETSPFLEVPQNEQIEVAGRFRALMPIAVTSFGAVSIPSENAIYVYGGYAGEPHVYHRGGQARTLWKLDLTSNRWVAVHDDVRGVQGVRLFAHDDRVCRVGGNQIMNAPGEEVVMESVGNIECFDGQSWQELVPLSSPRSSFDGALLGDGTYCLTGGWVLSGSPSDASWIDSTDCLDLESLEWTSFEQPFVRRAVASASDDGELVVIGGLDSEGSLSTEVQILNVASGEWREGPEFPEPAFGVSATSHEGQVVASGMTGTIYRLSDDNTVWEEAGQLAHRRFFHELVSASGEVLAFGGVGGMHTNGRVRVVESALPTSATFDVIRTPWPGASRNRQGMYLSGEFLYFIGGNNSLGQHDFEPDNFVSEGRRVHLPSMRIEEAASFPVTEASPHGRQTMSVLPLDGRALFVGGFGHDGEHAVSYGDSYYFDEQRFEAGPSLPAGRTQFGVAEHEGAVWIFGGLNYDPRRATEEDPMGSFRHETSILRLAPGGDAFEVSDVVLPSARRAFAGAELGGHYYLVGGMKENFQLVESCLDFDFSSQEFSEIPCPAARLSGELLAMDDKLILFGGSVRGDDPNARGLEESRAIEVFDPANPDVGWRTIAEVPFSTRHARAFVSGERLLVVSTHSEDDLLTVAYLDIGAAAQDEK